MSLFEASEARRREAVRPLAARMRPRTLDEYVGQGHVLGPGKLLRRLIDSDRMGSILLFGPPGVGKTTLAHLMSGATGRRFRQLSAVLHGVKELRTVLTEARDKVSDGGRPTLLFIDEIHRFNKAQQDALLPDVENGLVTLVGATTSNPSFAVIDALLSRSRVFQLEPLSEDDIVALLRRAIADAERGLGAIPMEADDDALRYLAAVSDGDARAALAALEIGVLSTDQRPVRFDRELAAESVQRRTVRYDPTGDDHYDCASALIKSIRGSDVDAGIYWLARMLEGGEDLRFLCRRLVILASEDIGNADPQALPMAVAAMQACEWIGLPEAQLILSQTVAYLACAPKSNAATMAIAAARADIREGRVLPVPKHLRDAHYAGAQQLGHGEGYQYSHHHDAGVAAQDYLGVDRRYYEPTDRGYEAELQVRLEDIRRRLKDA